MTDAPDRQQLLTALTTEHFTLQGARAQTLTDAAGTPHGVSAAVGAVAGALSIGVWLRVAARILARRVPSDPPLFPTPPPADRS